MFIDAEYLKSFKGKDKVCPDGLAWFEKNFPRGGEADKVIDVVCKTAKQYLWAVWLAIEIEWTGSITIYYDDGKLRWQEDWAHGVLHGRRRGFTPNGELYTEETYIEGRSTNPTLKHKKNEVQAEPWHKAILSAKYQKNQKKKKRKGEEDE
jgi:hypothetical protein